MSVRPVDHRAGGPSGDALSVMATQRSEHLTDLGFHSNELGAFLAIAYALGLGVWDGAESGRSRKRSERLLVVTAIALLLTFSRGAYLAFAVANVLVFMRGAPKKKAAFLVLSASLWLAAPAALVDRVGYGLDEQETSTRSVPAESRIVAAAASRYCRPSVVWTGAAVHHVDGGTRFQEIFPVNLLTTRSWISFSISV